VIIAMLVPLSLGRFVLQSQAAASSDRRRT
jgi:hypothetical protein